jgi:hypothetical protein
MSSFESVHSKANMKSRFVVLPSVLGLLLASSAVGQTPSGFPAASPVLPYTPSLDLSAMDRSADPCVDFCQYLFLRRMEATQPHPSRPNLLEREWQTL